MWAGEAYPSRQVLIHPTTHTVLADGLTLSHYGVRDKSRLVIEFQASHYKMRARFMGSRPQPYLAFCAQLCDTSRPVLHGLPPVLLRLPSQTAQPTARLRRQTRVPE
jgi:hypothetical protein